MKPNWKLAGLLILIMIIPDQCYQVCAKYHKPVIVMEPVKGGGLIKLADEAKVVLDALEGGSYAGYAIRYCAS